MKFPKPRANMFFVVRNDHTRAICGSFSNPEEALEFADSCHQEWKDRFPDWNDIPKFTVEVTTFYG